MATEERVYVPEAPSILPAALQAKWRDTYLKTHRQSQSDSPNEPGVHPQLAIRAANQHLEVIKPTNYEQAMALPDWQVVKRVEKDGKLVLVTIDGRGAEKGDSKFVFDVPTRGQKAEAAAAVAPVAAVAPEADGGKKAAGKN